MTLKWNKTKGMLNEMRLQQSNFFKNSSLTHAWKNAEQSKIIRYFRQPI